MPRQEHKIEEFYDYLNSLGIYNPPDVFEVVPSFDIDEIIQFAVQCYLLTEASNRDRGYEGIFNFSVGGAIGGGIFPCSEIQCRLINVQQLRTFSALYADKVLIPNLFEHIYHRLEHGFDFKNETQFGFFINHLLGDVVMMLDLQPLFKIGTLRINPQLGAYCKPCLIEKRKAEKKINAEFNKIEKRVAAQLARDVIFVFDKSSAIVVKDDPKNYLNGSVISFGILPKYLRSYVKKAPHSFSPQEVKKLKIYNYFISPVFDDLILQKYSMISMNTSYLTSSRLESEVIDNLTNNRGDNSSQEGKEVHGLIQNLPFVQNATLDSIIALRDREAESFAAYRDAIKIALAENKDKHSAKQVVEDVVSPAINKLELIIKNQQKSLVKQAGRKLLLNTLILTAGYFANEVSNVDMKTVLETMGVYKASEIGMDILKSKDIPGDAKNHDYYFLWKLKNQTRSHA